MPERAYEDVSRDEMMALCGNRDEHLRLIREATGAMVVARNTTLKVGGTDDQAAAAAAILERMREQFRLSRSVGSDDVRFFIQRRLAEQSVAAATTAATPAPAPGSTSQPANVSAAPGSAASPVGGAPGFSTAPSGNSPGGSGLGSSHDVHGVLTAMAGPLKRVKARTEGQIRYVEALHQHELTFGIGPAGTGKTFLAVAAAVEALHQRRIKRIVLVRPAVEAGEKLGFLPGDLETKVHPYLRPLLDALQEMLDFHNVQRYLRSDVIEIAPLAYMRGRTLNESYIILDEAQNTTPQQMQMFLTRMGQGSTIVVTGDPTQVDLPQGMLNGLDDAVRRLTGIPRVAVVKLTRSDIIRHPLVQAIVEAYEREEPMYPLFDGLAARPGAAVATPADPGQGSAPGVASAELTPAAVEPVA
jgi:phosphate starvation-inducible protein PhoH